MVHIIVVVVDMVVIVIVDIGIVVTDIANRATAAGEMANEGDWWREGGCIYVTLGSYGTRH